MGELFQKPEPKYTLEWTGERLTTGVQGQVEIEHFHRYFIARKMCRGLDVLDIAAGEGYGSAFIAQSAKSVVGVEVDIASVEHAQQSYVADNLRFKHGRAQAIPLPDQSVDCVVSFETVEHFYEQDLFVSEIRRVLRPGGFLLMSSPNRDIYSPPGRKPNPHHVRELTKEEFVGLLARRFANVKLFGQRPSVGSVVIHDGNEAPVEAVSFDRRHENTFEENIGLSQVIYWIAIASNEDLPSSFDSFYFEIGSLDDIFVELPRLRSDFAHKIDELKEMQRQNKLQVEDLRAKDSEIESKTEEFKTKESEYKSHIKELKRELQAEREKSKMELDNVRKKHLKIAHEMKELKRHSIACRIERFNVRCAAAWRHPFKREKRRKYRNDRFYTFKGIGPEHDPVLLTGDGTAISYVSGRYGPEHMPLYRNLFEVVDRYSDNREGFGQSSDCAALLDEARDLAAALSLGRPEASIVIPVYNNLHLTLTCIVSILATQADRCYEILVGDDRSTDGTSEVLSRIGSVVRVVKHEKNLGFVRNCNATASQAAGRFVVFLNNDTLVLPNWLDALERVLKADPSVGLVGSKLLNGDGTLQEAGGIFWRDGSAWNFGRNQNPALPEFNYLRDVDYISGASIAIPTNLWEELGGFDELFSPAYCEDADIAFRIRERGLRVVYQPFSEVFHHEGQSHGRDTSSGVKAYQVINQEKLFNRWRSKLETEHFPNGSNVFEARDRSAEKPHVLIIDHYVPQRDRDAGSRSMFMYMKLMKESGFQVSFWPDNLFYDRIYTEELQELGIEVIYGNLYNNKFEEFLAVRAEKIKYAFLSRPHISVNYLESIGNYKHIKKLYYGHDLHFMRMELEHEVTKDSSMLPKIKKMKTLEESVFKNCDVVFYPGDKEVEYVRQTAPHVHAVQIPVYIYEDEDLAKWGNRERSLDPADEIKLLFVGGFTHTPNIDGALWLAREVLPILRQSGVKFHLTIVGSNAPDSIHMLAGADIDVRGWVSDAELEKLYQIADLSVVPLRYGGGVKGKVIEALAKCIPVVTTSVGVQGILNPQAMTLIADTPSEFAEAISSVYCDRNSAAERASNGLNFMKEWYSTSAVRKLLSQSMKEMCQN